MVRSSLVSRMKPFAPMHAIMTFADHQITHPVLMLKLGWVDPSITMHTTQHRNFITLVHLLEQGIDVLLSVT